MNPKEQSEGRSGFVVRWVAAQPGVASYVSSVVRDFHEAEDLLQKVALIAYQKDDQYDPARSYMGWVCGIARFELLRWKRDKARNRHVFNDDVLKTLEAVQPAFEKEMDSRRLALRHCVEQFDGRGRDVLVLRYVEDLKPREIAEKIEMKSGAVRVMLCRLRAALEKCIQRKIATGGLGK